MKNSLMKIRFIGVAVLLIVSVLVCSVAVPASADEKTTTGGGTSADGTVSEEDLNRIVLDKYLDEDFDNDIYTLHVDSYVTGDINIIQSKEVLPADIVMVLDASASMTSNKIGSKTRLAVMQESAKAFLTKLAENSPEGTRQHRVSIIQFATEQATKTLTSSISGNDNSFVEIKDSSTGKVKTALTNAINNLTTGNATRTDLGMKMAYTQLSARKTTTFTDSEGETQKRPVAVLLFTDGMPASVSNITSYATFTDESFQVANPAIEQANKIKKDFAAGDREAQVYTVAVSGNADVQPTKSYNFTVKTGTTGSGSNRRTTYTLTTGAQAMNAMLHFISSDYSYKEFQGSTDPLILIPDRKKVVDNHCYKSAESADELLGAFEAIAKSIINVITVEKVSKQAIIKDILSNYFELPEDADNIEDIKIYESNCNGYDATHDKYLFDDEHHVEIGNPEVTATYNPEIKVIVDKEKVEGEDKERDFVSVTGFDFAANYVGHYVDPADGKTKYTGKKLEIIFKIKLIEGFAGGNKVPTNAPDSGIYLDPEHNQPLKPYPKPTINKEIIEQDFDFELDDVVMYKTNVVTADEFLTIDSMSGIEYDYVEREIWYKESIDAEFVRADDEKFAPSVTTVYPEGCIKVVLKPKKIDDPSLEEPIGELAEEVVSYSKADFTIYVLQPSVDVNVNDIQRYYGTDYTLGDGQSDLSAITVNWKEPNNLATTPSAGKEGIQKPFDASDITLGYSVSGLSGNKTTITKDDLTVSVTPKFKNAIEPFNVAESDLVSKVVTPTVTTTCTYKDTCGASRTDGTYKVHPIMGTLTVNCTGGKDEDTHIYQIKKDGSVYTTVALKKGESAVLKELPAGIYDVVPLEDWDLNNTPTFKDEKKQAIFANNVTSDEITVIHTTTADSKWLGSYSSVEQNVYGVAHS